MPLQDPDHRVHFANRKGRRDAQRRGPTRSRFPRWTVWTVWLIVAATAVFILAGGVLGA